MPVSRSIRDARYNKKSSRFFSVKMNVNKDAELIARLESVDSVNAYIHRLIREDIERSASAKQPDHNADESF